MSLTAIVWLVLFVLLTILSFLRPIWGVCLYLLTFYLAPAFWWWGRPILDLTSRFNLLAALILAAAVFTQSAGSLRFNKLDRKLFALLLFFAVNATLVHYLFADNPERSYEAMTMVWKQVGLLYLIICSVRNRKDFNILLATIVIGSLYIAYEIVVNDRGNIEAGRLEGVGAPGAAEANYLAGLMAFAIPLAGYWLFFGANYWLRGLSVVSLVLIFEVLLRCNSRGAFLALIAAGAWLLFVATGRARKHAMIGILLGCLAAYLMIGNDKIINRFMTTFAPAEERDASAASRLDFWKAATRMIKDYPLGSGGEAAFKSERGYVYIRPLGEIGQKAVHNGYLDIGAAWGVQGLSVYLAVILLSWKRIRNVRREATASEDGESAFLGASLESVFVSQAVVCMFISSLDGEWFFWWFALSVAYERLYSQPQDDTLYVPAVESRRRTVRTHGSGHSYGM